MNLNPLTLFRRDAKSSRDGANVTARESRPEGPYSAIFESWVAREVNPWLYEAIREAVGPIDGAINRIVTLDGIVKAQAESDALQRELDDWMEGVQVNDLEQGFQAFYRSQGNELYEQGCTIGEFVLDERARDVVRLNVADSKGIYFRRPGGVLEVWYAPPGAVRGRRDGTDQIERVLRNTYPQAGQINLNDYGYRPIDPSRLVYAGFNNEADNPYGVSLMRSTEFDARALLTMKNALHRVWDRFGDPSFVVTYKTKSKADPGVLETRRTTLANNLAEVMRIKRSGNSADFVNAVGKDDDLEIAVLGADGQVLEIEMPARHVLESIVSKTGVPAWMLGFHWSTAERLAQRQGEMALQESRTRFASRRPGLIRVISTALRARGVTWGRGDWEIVQDLPSLQDLVAQSQARFLDAQTQMMLGGRMPEADDDPGGKLAKVTPGGHIIFPIDAVIGTEGVKSAGHRCKAETYVENEAELMRLERRAERGLLVGWRQLQAQSFRALGIDEAKGAKQEPVFVFDAALMSQTLLDLQDEFVQAVGAEDAELAGGMYQAWLVGVSAAAQELDVDALVEEVRQRVQRSLADSGLALVRDASTRAFRDDILEELQRGAYDGQNPRDVARALRRRFEAHEYDWERLARSEIAQAQSQGKLDQYAEAGLEQYDWIPSGDACPICWGRANAGPYTVGAGPLPMRDSHPNCRCSVAAVVA